MITGRPPRLVLFLYINGSKNLKRSQSICELISHRSSPRA
ncbi:MAG: hypothetical protein CG445_634, partial [Methanosaeta sp. ASM2]